LKKNQHAQIKNSGGYFSITKKMAQIFATDLKEIDILLYVQQKYS